MLNYSIIMKTKVGEVTEEEKKEILTLFERKNGLAELAKIVKSNDALYDKMVMDMGVTATKFQAWWDRMAIKYQWESKEDGNWEINFETNEIILCT
jgi:CXXX repeat modification system protein